MITPSYPGVYIEEVPSGVRPITGVATSITAFIGRAQRGPTSTPVRIQNFGEYQRMFGALWDEAPMSYAVRQFFDNGGIDAVIVRVHNAAVSASLTIGGFLSLQAASQGRGNPGEWANSLSAEVDDHTRDEDDTVRDPTLFNLTLRLYRSTAMEEPALALEQFMNLSTDPNSPKFVTTVLASASQLARVNGAVGAMPIFGDPETLFLLGDDGAIVDGAAFIDPLDPNFQAGKQGIYAFEDTDLFNLMNIPRFSLDNEVTDAVLAAALTYCQARRAMLIIDPMASWATPGTIAPLFNALRSTLGGMNSGRNAMAYFPNLRIPDPVLENRLRHFPPGGAMAGIFARTDAQRGVWKAPAGIEAGVIGAKELSYPMTDGENGLLNPLGLNCIRTKVPYGHIAWGARTLAGDDRMASEWKYIPIRRTALYIEESLFRGLHWVVFEPNDEPLWAQIRMNTKAFMQNLFKKGAFQGVAAKDAYFVKCDYENNPQSQIDLGIVTVTVGFAPLKPAEFVIIQIQQMAGQLEA